MIDPRRLLEDFKAVVPDVAFWSLRLVQEHSDGLTVREGVLQPPLQSRDQGVHITLIDRGGAAWAATGELGRAGLAAACAQAGSTQR